MVGSSAVSLIELEVNEHTVLRLRQGFFLDLENGAVASRTSPLTNLFHSPHNNWMLVQNCSTPLADAVPLRRTIQQSS